MDANERRILYKLWKDRHTHTGGELQEIEQRLIRVETGLDSVATHIVPFSWSGALEVSSGGPRLVFPVDATLVSVVASCGVAPAGAAVIVDVNLNGTTIFTTQANRPTIADGGNQSAVATPDVTAVSPGDYLTVDIDQVGSVDPGEDLTVTVVWSN